MASRLDPTVFHFVICWGPRNSLFEAFVVCSVAPRKDQMCKHKGESHKKKKSGVAFYLTFAWTCSWSHSRNALLTHTHTFDTMCYLLKHAKCLHGLKARRLLPRVLFRGFIYFEREPAAHWLVCIDVQEKPTIHNMPPCKSDSHKTHLLCVIGRNWR